MREMEVILKRLVDFSNRNIQLWTEDGKIKFKAAAGVLTLEDKNFLKENKDVVIECLLQENVTIVEDRKNQYEPFGMTEIQQAYVLGRNPAFSYGGCACHIYMELEYDELDAVRVQNVWNTLIQRHPMLRTVMSVEGYQQTMETTREFEVALFQFDGEEETVAGRRAIKKEFDHKIYQPQQWPLYSVIVSKGEGKDILHLSIEFVTADWTSIWTILAEFESLYFSPEKELEELNVTFRDYLVAEKKLRGGSRFFRDREYWLKRMDELPGAPDLPILNNQNFECARFERNQFGIDKAQWDNFCKYARHHGITPTAAVMCAYSTTLAKWSQNKSFCLNLSILNRLELHPQIGKIVGDFTASSLLEVNSDGKKSFAENALKVNQQLFDDLDHRLFTGVHVLRELQQRKNNKNILMPYVFTGAIGLIAPEKSALVGKMNQQGISQTPQVFMDCQAMDTAEGLNINIDSRQGVFPEGMVKDICDTMKELLETLASNEDVWSKIPFEIQIPKWQEEIYDKANATYAKQRKYLLHEDVIEQLKKHPAKMFVADSVDSFNGERLLREAQKINTVLQNQGVKRGDFVAIAMSKSRWQIPACLGILMAGAAYVPIDVEQAYKRNETILEKVNAKIILSKENEAAQYTKNYQVIHVDCIAEQSAYADEITADGADTAYIIFTSGSTGEPKGVTMSHYAAINTIEAMNQMFDVNETDCAFQISQLNFDLSVYDIFGVLGAGGAVVIPDKEQYKNPAHWVEMINKYQVTIWNSVPALMQMLLIYQSYNKEIHIHPLKTVLLSGDWIPMEQPEKIKNLFENVRVVSLGGATEGGIWSIYHECGKEDASFTKSIPYGKPLPNQGFLILDKNMQKVPVWVPGELYITGKSLADSYWGEEKLTDNAFLNINGMRAYKTGDMGCYHPNGEIEFLGRADYQVKLRGHRIELGEIEAVIQKQLETKYVCCVMHKGNEEQKLVAVIQGGAESATINLEESLKAWLPKYMIPSMCIVVEEMPLTANGKIDRRAIAVIVEKEEKQKMNTAITDENMNELETQICNVMKEALQVEKLSLTEDFYEAGANSLILARAAGQLNQQIESSIPFDVYLVQLLNEPNVKALAQFVKKERKTGETVTEKDNDKVNAVVHRNEGVNDLCILFTEGLRSSFIQQTKSLTGINIIYVPEKNKMEQMISQIEKEKSQNGNLYFVASDIKMSQCLQAAIAMMEQEVVPEKVYFIETEQESEVEMDISYMGDVGFIMTVSELDCRDEIQEIMEEFCMGNVEVCRMENEKMLVEFLGNINGKER